MIIYRKGKYVLVSSFKFTPTLQIRSDFDDVFLTASSKKNTVTVMRGYPWDGMTWWADSQKNMHASLVHDIEYELIRQKSVPAYDRVKADKELMKNLVTAGTNKIVAGFIYRAVRLFGSRYVKEKYKKKNFIGS